MRTEQAGNQVKYLVNKQSFEDYQQEEQMLISKKEAALVLGIQKDSIPKLISAGLLKTYRKTTNRNELLSLEEVKLLMSDCRGKLVNGKIKGVKFHDALIKYSVNGLTIVRVIEFTKARVLHPIANILVGSLSDNFYLIDELEACINILKKDQLNERGYYLSEVLKVLKIGEKKAWAWMNNGVLIPDNVITLKNGRKKYLFNKSKIDAMSKIG